MNSQEVQEANENASRSWKVMMGSYVILGATYLLGNHKSGLEEYLHNPDMNLAAKSLAFSGLGLHFSAFYTFLKHYKKDKKKVVTRAPYSFVRHPSYLGMRMVAVGGAMLNPTFEMIAATSAVFLTTGITAIAEEKLLKAMDPKEYKVLKENASRWIPFGYQARDYGKKLLKILGKSNDKV